MFNIFDRNETYPRKILRTSVSANIMVQNCAKIHQNLFEIVTVINTCYSLSVRAEQKMPTLRGPIVMKHFLIEFIVTVL